MSRVKIRELRLRNYKAFPDVSLLLDEVTFLVGRNGAGKTTLLDAFAFVSEAVTDSLSVALERRGNLDGIRHRVGEKTPRHDVSFDIGMDVDENVRADYRFTLGSNRRGGFSVKNEDLNIYEKGKILPMSSFSREGTSLHIPDKQFAPRINSEYLILPRLAGSQKDWSLVFDALKNIALYRLSPEKMRSEQDIGREQLLARDGGNAGDVLRRMERPDREWVVRHLAASVPGIVDVEATARAGRRVIVFKQKGAGSRVNRFDASSMSEGTIRALGILLALRQVPRPSIVLLDEIEDSLHQYAQDSLLDAIEAASDEFPIVVTTHNTDVLSHTAATGKRIRVVQWNKGSSRLYHVRKEVIDNLKPPETVGRLMRHNALWPEEEPMTSEATKT